MKKIINRIKRLFKNIKSIEWARLKVVFGGIGNIVVFTGFFICLFTLIDFCGGLFTKLIGG